MKISIEKVPHTFEARWLEPMALRDYHRQNEAISASGLKHLLRSPRHFAHLWSCEQKQSESSRIGNLVHGAILEPDRFRKSMRITPAVDKRTKAGKELYESWLKERSPDDIIVTEDDYHYLCGILEAVYKHPIARGLLVGGDREKTGVFGYEGLKCRIRPDLISMSDSIIVDVKTCQSADRRSVERSVMKYSYDLQAAFYLLGASKITGRSWDKFAWLFVEKYPPHVTSVYWATESLQQHGRFKVDQCISTLKKCLDSNEWPGYQTEAEWLDVPEWAKGEVYEFANTAETY